MLVCREKVIEGVTHLVPVKDHVPFSLHDLCKKNMTEGEPLHPTLERFCHVVSRSADPDKMIELAEFLAPDDSELLLHHIELFTAWLENDLTVDRENLPESQD